MAFSPLEDGEGGSGCWAPYPVCGFLRPSQEEKVVAPTWGDGGPLGVMEEREGERRFRGGAEGRETSINPRWKTEGEGVKESNL